MSFQEVTYKLMLSICWPPVVDTVDFLTDPADESDCQCTGDLVHGGWNLPPTSNSIVVVPALPQPILNREQEHSIISMSRIYWWFGGSQRANLSYNCAIASLGFADLTFNGAVALPHAVTIGGPNLEPFAR
jgi:hypothetical protein